MREMKIPVSDRVYEYFKKLAYANPMIQTYSGEMLEFGVGQSIGMTLDGLVGMF